MLVVREAREDDLDAFYDLIQQAECGLTTLKISREELASRLEQSQFAFSQKSPRPSGKPYVLVMEDLASGKLVGTSAIYSKVGGFEPLYSYQIQKSIHQSQQLDVRKEIDTLHLLEQHDGPTEIGGLFLSPDYWGKGHGRLLSLSRFLFMAEFPERFEPEVIAEMRGISTAEGKSPLWSALGAHFFQMEFPKAERLTASSKKLIAELMPRHPIYIPLLPEDAQQVIGRVHKNTAPALNLLESEGFEFRKLVDIFDGGPTVHCRLADIRTVRESRRGTVGAIEDQVSDGQWQLVSNACLNYRACMGDVGWSEDGLATIDQNTALRLGLKVGDAVRTVHQKPRLDSGKQEN